VTASLVAHVTFKADFAGVACIRAMARRQAADFAIGKMIVLLDFGQRGGGELLQRLNGTRALHGMRA